MEQPSTRVDVLDAGRDPVALGERWRDLPVGRRRALLAGLSLLLLLGALLFADVQRRRAARDAAVALDARLLTATLVTDRQSLGFSLRVVNRGPVPVSVERGYVGLAGVGLLAARLDAVVLPPGRPADVVVQWGFPQCRLLPGGPVDDTALRLRVRTADGVLRDARVPVPDLDPAGLLQSVACPLAPLPVGAPVSGRSDASP